MYLNKDLIEKLYPALVAYCKSDEGFTSKSKLQTDGDRANRKIFSDINEEACYMQTSSAAMYIGMWLGTSDYPMHLNIAKGRVIKKKMEEFLKQ